MAPEPQQVQQPESPREAGGQPEQKPQPPQTSPEQQPGYGHPPDEARRQGPLPDQKW